MANLKPIMLGLTVVCGGMMLPACAPQPQSADSDIYQRQEAAMKDPFHSSPGHMDTDITGGGVGNIDKKAWNQDVDHVINP
jgi:hypothetical protein